MTREQTARRPFPGWAYAVGDAFVLVLFVLIGLQNHDHAITTSGLERTALPILSAWFAISLFAGTYTRPGIRTLLITWVFAIPIGIAIRAAALHRAADHNQVAFGIVALVFTITFLLVWRGIAAFASRRR